MGKCRRGCGHVCVGVKCVLLKFMKSDGKIKKKKKSSTGERNIIMSYTKSNMLRQNMQSEVILPIQNLSYAL